MKKLLFIIFILFLTVPCFSQNTKQKYLKGNLLEKTNILKEALDDDRYWLSKQAINFVYENFEIFSDDRDFENFAITAIYSIPDFNVTQNISKTDYEQFGNILHLIYKTYKPNSNIKCAILSKYSSLKAHFPTNDFVNDINLELQNSYNSFIDKNLYYSIITTLGIIGNNNSFVLLFDDYAKNKSSLYREEIKTSLTNLIPTSMEEFLKLIHSKDFTYLRATYSLINENSKIFQNNLSEIAENLLNESILYMSVATENNEELIAIQLGALRILNEKKCTRAASSVISYFEVCKQQFNKNLISKDEFIEVVNTLGNLAPISSVSPLVNYLEEINKLVENGSDVSYDVVMSVIKTLGSIGDKTAFDCLLAVTYLNYPDYVLSATREALAGLKW